MPTNLTLTDTSDLERAMAATLKRLDSKSENGAATKASTSESSVNGTKTVKNKFEKIEKVVEIVTDAQEGLKKRQADKFRELIRDKVSRRFFYNFYIKALL